jgi:hypothetical protein
MFSIGLPFSGNVMRKNLDSFGNDDWKLGKPEASVLNGDSGIFRSVDSILHALANPEIGINYAAVRNSLPRQARINAPLAFLGIIVVQNAGLGIKQMAGNGRLATAQAVVNALASILCIFFNIPRERRFENY